MYVSISLLRPILSVHCVFVSLANGIPWCVLQVKVVCYSFLTPSQMGQHYCVIGNVCSVLGDMRMIRDQRESNCVFCRESFCGTSACTYEWKWIEWETMHRKGYELGNLNLEGHCQSRRPWPCVPRTVNVNENLQHQPATLLLAEVEPRHVSCVTWTVYSTG